MNIVVVAGQTNDPPLTRAYTNPFLTPSLSSSTPPSSIPSSSSSSSSPSGRGLVVATRHPTGRTTLTQLSYRYPLKLLTPPSSTAHLTRLSALLFILSYGGGLVAGDVVDLVVRVDPGARLSAVTQGHTKIFSPKPEGDEGVANGGEVGGGGGGGGAPGTTSTTNTITTRQVLRVSVARGAALCLLPDPVQPFEGSVYEQKQVFKLAMGDDEGGGGGGSLCMLDWVTQGRTARGEDWSFVRWTGRNEVWLTTDVSSSSVGTDTNAPPNTHTNPAERLLLRDAIVLDATDTVLTHPLRASMHALGVFGTLILAGPLLEPLGAFFLTEFAALPRVGGRDFRSAQEVRDDAEAAAAAADDLGRWRARRIAAEKRGRVLWSAARVRTCVVVKFGATTVEAARTWMGGMLVREGTVAAVFGEQALMCVR